MPDDRGSRRGDSRSQGARHPDYRSTDFYFPEYSSTGYHASDNDFTGSDSSEGYSRAAETHATPAAEVPVMLTAVIPAAGMHAIPAAQIPVMPTDIPTTEVPAVITPAIRREEAPIPQAKRAPATQESMEIIIPQENTKKQVSTLTVPENRRAISCRFPSFSEWA